VAKLVYPVMDTGWMDLVKQRVFPSAGMSWLDLRDHGLAIMPSASGGGANKWPSLDSRRLPICTNGRQLQLRSRAGAAFGLGPSHENSPTKGGTNIQGLWCPSVSKGGKSVVRAYARLHAMGLRPCLVLKSKKFSVL